MAVFKSNFDYVSNHKIWEGVIVVYHTPSGNTVTINLFCHDIMMQLGEQSSKEHLLDKLSLLYIDDNAEQIEIALNNALKQLIENQLIETVSIST